MRAQGFYSTLTVCHSCCCLFVVCDCDIVNGVVCLTGLLPLFSLLYDNRGCYYMYHHESYCLCSSPLWATSPCSSLPSMACCLAGSEPLKRRPTVSTCRPASWWPLPCQCVLYWRRCWCCSPVWHASCTRFARASTAVSTGASAWSRWARPSRFHLRELPLCDPCSTELSAPLSGFWHILPYLAVLWKQYYYIILNTTYLCDFHWKGILLFILCDWTVFANM